MRASSRITCMIMIAASVIALCGCEPIMRELQFTNPETGLFPMRMDLQVGNGRTDAAKLIAEREYDGSVALDGVMVHYPAGMESLASDVASAFVEAEREVRERTGVTWAFKPNIYLVTVDDPSGGFRLQIPIRAHREMSLPMLIVPGREPSILPSWSRGLAHEITEASMLASLRRRETVLGDYCFLGMGLVNETRWFREGVAEYSGDILNEKLFGDRYQPPPWIYESLALTRGSLLTWDNCSSVAGSGVYYDASLALIREIINHAGEDAVAQIMLSASEHKYINGSTLRRTVEEVTGLDVRRFLMNYQPVWLGMDLRDSKPVGAYMTAAGNEVRVARVYPDTPADRWKLRAGDRIVTVDGKQVRSSAWFTHYLATLSPLDRVHIELERGGERRSHRMIVVARDI